MIDSLGGFCVIELTGDLAANSPLSFEIGFVDPYFWVSNRAWHPQGPYLRMPDGSYENVQMDVVRGVKTKATCEQCSPDGGLALVPAPSQWLPSGSKIHLERVDASGAFLEAIRSASNLSERRNFGDLLGGSTPLTVNHNPDLPANSYHIDIDPAAIEIEAQSQAAVFHAAITLVSLRFLYQNHIPCGRIVDEPRFEWRGFMLDCAREYYPIDAIKKLLDVMALMKLNRFHWHFADDEAFRVEVESAPDIWQKSAYRGEGEVLPGLFGGEPGPRGGSYSKSEVAELVGYARQLHIEILPEIEVPAHALALTEIRPELRDCDDTGSEVSVQGYVRNTVNPAKKETWNLLEPLALEIADLFPFRHLHLGGDELPAGTWNGSSLVNELRERHTLETPDDVLGHVLNRLAGHIRRDDIVPCAWEEAVGGQNAGIDNDAILFSWTGHGPGLNAARRGYQVVMCPAQHTYFDMAHTMDSDDWGANWAANFALDETINWDPVPDNEREIESQILGVQANFWSEFTSSADQYEAMIAPRILGFATKAWTARNSVNLTELRTAACHYEALFSTFGWHSHTDAIFAETPPGARRRSSDDT